MATTYYSPDGNAEIWNEKPENYCTETEWQMLIEAQKRIEEEEKLRIMMLPENLYESLLLEVDNKYNKAMVDLTKKYPDVESATFYKQLQEAKDFLQTGSLADAPFISNVAKQRDMSPNALATRIVEKADAHAAICGYLLGLRYKYRKAIETVGNTDTKALLDIAVDFTIVDEEVVQHG